MYNSIRILFFLAIIILASLVIDEMTINSIKLFFIIILTVSKFNFLLKTIILLKYEIESSVLYALIYAFLIE
nr:hypothetical protein [Enterobacteriaceae endosymbiont of Plateumaris rustica]